LELDLLGVVHCLGGSTRYIFLHSENKIQKIILKKIIDE
jgi:hypothetical protein